MASDREPGDGESPPADERVGYGRPPSASKIKPGEQRNPWGRAGRPKPRKEFLDGKIVLRIDGNEKTVTRDEALDHFLFEAASRRNVSAVKELDLRRQNRIARALETAESGDLTPEDEVALLRAAERRLRRLGLGNSDGDSSDGGSDPEPD